MKPNVLSQVNRSLYPSKPHPFVLLTLPCRDLAEMQRAKEAVLYHLETLNPEFSAQGNTLTVRVIPIDPTLFRPDEACDIIRQTLAPSLSFLTTWTCHLRTLTNQTSPQKAILLPITKNIT